MITFTVIRGKQRVGVAIRDEYAGREVTLPTGDMLPIDMIGVVHLTPTGRVGVPVTIPDPKRSALKAGER